MPYVDDIADDVTRPTSLCCRGILDARTRRHVLDEVQTLLAHRPSRVCIDVRELVLADVEGARTLTQVQRLVRDAGAILSWDGLDADRIRGLISRGPVERSAPTPRGVSRVPGDPSGMRGRAGTPSTARGCGGEVIERAS